MQFLTIDDTDVDYIKAKMSLVLIHEIAHIMGLYEAYEDVNHTPNNNDSANNKTGAMECAMDMYNSAEGSNLYNNSTDDYGNVNGNPFCADCTNKLTTLVPSKVIYGN